MVDPRQVLYELRYDSSIIVMALYLVKVKSLSDFEERFLKPGMRWLQKENEPPSKIELISGFKQPGKETFVVKFLSLIHISEPTRPR